MANKAAIDFGNSNTVMALWNEALQAAKVLRVPEFCLPGSALIPSRVAYEDDGRFFIGSQIQHKASAGAREFRWMKRYLSLRSPYSLRVGDERIDAGRAAEDFLHALTASAFSEAADAPDELILSIPVESFEHYSDWILSRMKRFENLHLRLIDEASAAAAGYGLSLHPGDTLLVLDFGGSTLQSVCVSVSEAETMEGRCCRVLGKAGCSLGGMTMDRWLYEAVLQQLSLSENDPLIRHNSAELLRYCESVKIALSDVESLQFDFFPDRSFLLTREKLNMILRQHGLFDSLRGVIEETLRMAEDHGLMRQNLTAVLPVGGSCLVPVIQENLETIFPSEKIVWGEPLTAVARGAAVIGGGMHIYDFIQHSYAIRYTDPVTGNYAFHTIVPKGTKYPDPAVTGAMKLKASYDGQQNFGIAIYELLESGVKPVNTNELFFDTDGSVRVMPLTEEESRAEQRFWMNERNPLFLKADTPAERGISRFSVSFGIDSNKMLLISARDMVSDLPVLINHPVIRLN